MLKARVMTGPTWRFS